jgi:eukaryotic translation initiation factor 2C
MTNHYTVEFNPSQNIYQYDVAFEEGMDRAKMPKKKLWGLIGDMIKTHGHTTFGNIPLAYDGRANLYATTQLPSIGSEIEVAFMTKGRRGDEEKKVTLRLSRTMSLADVRSYLDLRNPSIPQDCFTAMDIVLRNMPSVRLTQFGACFYSDDKKAELSGGADLWFGHFQSLRVTQSGLTLNVDTTATAFVRPQPLLQYVCSLCKKRSVEELIGGRGLSPRDLKMISSGLNRIMVTVNHRPGCTRTFKIGGLTKQGADQMTFTNKDKDGNNTQTFNVAQYFSTKYGALRYPTLPCLRIGSAAKANFLPMEVCSIAPGQKLDKLSDEHTSEIIRQTCMKPYARNAAIHDQYTKAAGIIGGYSESFGIRLRGNAVAVEGRILDAPGVMYGKNNAEQPRGGTWNLINKTFVTGATLSVWSVVCLVGRQKLSQEALQSYVQQQVQMCKKSGITVRQERPVLEYLEDYSRERKTIADVMLLASNKARDAAGGKPAEFILVIKFSKEREEYREIKVCSDTQLGIACQCVTIRIAGNPNPSCLANIALQINAKLGGVNSIIQDKLPGLDDCPTIIMGADVNHPGVMNTSKPSVAAVTASMDRYASLHAGVCRVQSHRKEIIQDLAEMTTELLISFYRRNNTKPQRILFYRDGVGENQFMEVASGEIVKIKEACNKLEAGYSPKITFIIVQKRHHTRLFAHDQNDQDKSGNVQAGTFVDTGICSAHGYDFYLCSHAGLQGTSKPTYYYVLSDENKIPPNILANLTYKLCYMYTACTRAISTIPAAYYAHLMAFRGAFYIRDVEDSQTESSSSETEDAAREVNWAQNYQAPHPDVTRNMYFV